MCTLCEFVEAPNIIITLQNFQLFFYYQANKVTHLEGHGKITGANQVSVLNPDGSVKEVVNTKNIMIATGNLIIMVT